MSHRQLSDVGLNSWSSPIINRNWQRGLETSTGFLIFMFNITQAVKGSSVYSSCNVEWNYVNVLLWKNRRQSSWVITDNHDRMLFSTSSPLETPTPILKQRQRPMAIYKPWYVLGMYPSITIEVQTLFIKNWLSLFFFFRQNQQALQRRPR